MANNTYSSYVYCLCLSYAIMGKSIQLRISLDCISEKCKYHDIFNSETDPSVDDEVLGKDYRLSL